MSDAEQVLEQQWVFTGRRWAPSNNKLVQRWETRETGEEHLYLASKPIVSSAPVGGIYRVALDAEGRVFTGGERRPAYIGHIDNGGSEHDQKMLEWAAADKVAAQHQADSRRERKAGDRDVIRETLLPLRQLAAKLPYADRAALANAVLGEYWRPLDPRRGEVA